MFERLDVKARGYLDYNHVCYAIGRTLEDYTGRDVEVSALECLQHSVTQLVSPQLDVPVEASSLKAVITGIMAKAVLSDETPKTIRREAERQMGLQGGELDVHSWKVKVKAAIDECAQSRCNAGGAPTDPGPTEAAALPQTMASTSTDPFQRICSHAARYTSRPVDVADAPRSA